MEWVRYEREAESKWLMGDRVGWLIAKINAFESNPYSVVGGYGGVKKVGKKAIKKVAKVKTPHTVSTKRPPDGGKAGEPNSIWEQQRPDGSRSVTYFDEQGRRFSREDYGQLRSHGEIGKGVPHEHGYRYSDRGPIGQQYRELDPDGRPVGPWIDD
jgi:filamentous hemagglutinin